MTLTALIKFDQGPNTDIAGRAVKGTLTDGPITVSNGDNTDVELWEYELTYVPPGSAIPLAVQGPGVLTTFTILQPDVPGTYRVKLKVYDPLGATDVDIRCFCVPFPNGQIAPPYQGIPAPRPLEGSLAKPNEINVGGQLFGWDGDDDLSRPMMFQLIKRADTVFAEYVSKSTNNSITAVHTFANGLIAAGDAGSPITSPGGAVPVPLYIVGGAGLDAVAGAGVLVYGGAGGATGNGGSVGVVGGAGGATSGVGGTVAVIGGPALSVGSSAGNVDISGGAVGAADTGGFVNIAATGSDAVVNLKHKGVVQAQFYLNSADLTPAGTSTLRARAGYIEIGGTPSATVGLVRLPSNQSITARNVGDSADITLIKANAADAVELNGGTFTVTSTAVGVNATTFEFDATVVSPVICQMDDGTADTTGDTLVVQAQTCDGLNSYGGCLDLKSGKGVDAAHAGELRMYSGTTKRFSIEGAQLFIADTAGATADPVGGHFLYSQAGALKGRGSSGTITTIAAAEPHCPRCGRDFVLEWRNDELGYGYLGVCVACMCNALEQHGVARTEYTLAA